MQDDYYGFNVLAAARQAHAGGDGGAVASDDDPAPSWNPSSENSDSALMQGSLSKKSAIDRNSADSKGWFSCRVLVMGAPKCIPCKQGSSNKMTTMVEVDGMLMDHPGNPDGIKINQPEYSWIEDEGMTLVVALMQKGLEQTEGGGSKPKTVVYPKRNLRLRRGSVFKFTFFGKDKLRDRENNDLPCDFGDILRVSGVTRKCQPGNKPDARTGKLRFFESMNATESVHLGRLWDAQWEPFQSQIFSTMFNWLPETHAPRFKRMVVPEDFDYSKAADEKRKKKEEERAKAPQQSAAAGGAAVDAAAAESQQQRRQYVTTKPLIMPAAEDGYEAATVQTNLDDMKEVGDEALSEESKRFKWDNPDIYVPIHVPDKRVVSFLRTVQFPFTGYICQPVGAMRLDPTNRDLFRRERRPEAGKPAPPPEAPKVYDPIFKIYKRVLQMMPPGTLPLIQEVLFDATAFSETIRFYGICDPVAQMEVLPYLAASTPAVLRSWINGRMSAKNTADMNDPNRFAYVLTATTKRWQRQKDGPLTSKPQVGLMADVACGVVSAGYRITQRAACEILDALGKRPEYAQVTEKVQRQVAADMANPRIKNIYGKSNKPEQLNPLNNCVQDPPVINCCESTINWVQYGENYHFYVVSNWAEKNFAKHPELQQVIEQLGADPTEQFSKLFTEIAKTGTLADPEQLEYFGPSAFTEYKVDEHGARPVAIDPRPKPSELPFQCVVFALRRDYVKARGFEQYHGDNAFVDVVGKCEDYLKQWEAKAIAQRQQATAEVEAKKKADDEAAAAAVAVAQPPPPPPQVLAVPPPPAKAAAIPPPGTKRKAAAPPLPTESAVTKKKAAAEPPPPPPPPPPQTQNADMDEEEEQEEEEEEEAEEGAVEDHRTEVPDEFV